VFILLDFWARIPGNITALNTTKTFYNIVAFKNPWDFPRTSQFDITPEILFATFTDVSNPLKPPETSTRTAYGNAPHFTFDLYHNMTVWKKVEVWGIQCKRFHEVGYLNTSRLGSLPDGNFVPRGWFNSEGQFGSKAQLNYTYLGLTNGPGYGVQALAPSYHWPRLPLGGIGSPMAVYTCPKTSPYDSLPPLNCVPEYGRWVFNFLLISVEMERYVSELADRPGRNTTGKQLLGDPFARWPRPWPVPPPEKVEVRTTDTDLTYRMSYIPALWIGAVTAMLLASCVPLLLLWTAKRIDEVEITPLRLMVETARAMKDDREFEDTPLWTAKRLNSWANRTKVRFQLQISDEQDIGLSRHIVLNRERRYSEGEGVGEEEALFLG
jgi:hypothetical protein